MSVERACHNRLLRALDEANFAWLQPHFVTVPLRMGEVLIEPGRPILRAYFIEDGIVSLIATASDGEQTELGLTGREGMVGLPLLLGADRTPHESRVQASGYALSLPTEVFHEALGSDPQLQRLLLGYVQAVTVQIASTVVANTRYKVAQRLARWLLMCHDRTVGDDLATQQRFLAMMIGVNRPGLTAILSTFERAGLITRRRGSVTVRDRDGLLALAGASYGAAEAEYERLIEPFRADRASPSPPKLVQPAG